MEALDRNLRPKRSSIPRRTALALGLLAFIGCVAPKPPSDEHPLVPMAVTPDRPQVVTDLSTLSAAPTVAIPQTLPVAPTIQATSTGGVSRNEQMTHHLAADAPATRYDPNAQASRGPGDSRLLNDKARQYADFSYILLKQTLDAAQQLEPDKLSNKRVPVGLGPVVLTAVMDAQGRLNEIVVEQHSGALAIDHLFIDACKKGIWSRNPPVGARADDGNYRIRIQGSVANLSFDRYGEYSYVTDIGLGIL
jgi:hypothetical protein